MKSRPSGSVELSTIDPGYPIYSYSTKTATFTKAVCLRESRQMDVRVRLTDSELSSILEEAKRIDFFRMPGNMRTDRTVPGHPDEISLVAPCASYRLRIESGGKQNEVEWDCDLEGRYNPPDRIAPLVSMICKTIESKPEVRALRLRNAMSDSPRWFTRYSQSAAHRRATLPR